MDKRPTKGLHTRCSIDGGVSRWLAKSHLMAERVQISQQCEAGHQVPYAAQLLLQNMTKGVEAR